MADELAAPVCLNNRSAFLALRHTLQHRQSRYSTQTLDPPEEVWYQIAQEFAAYNRASPLSAVMRTARSIDIFIGATKRIWRAVSHDFWENIIAHHKITLGCEADDIYHLLQLSYHPHADRLQHLCLLLEPTPSNHLQGWIDVVQRSFPGLKSLTVHLNRGCNGWVDSGLQRTIEEAFSCGIDNITIAVTRKDGPYDERWHSLGFANGVLSAAKQQPAVTHGGRPDWNTDRIEEGLEELFALVYKPSDDGTAYAWHWARFYWFDHLI